MSTTNSKTIYAKLNEARRAFHAQAHEKSGENKYANYFYFELSDFLPDALKAFDSAGLCGVVSFGAEEARMKIVDVESGAVETIATPMSSAALKGCHPVQNLGAVQTYLRRYLWSAAIELVEADKVDATVAEDKETLPKDRFVAKKFPAVVEKKEAPKPFGRQIWEGHILEVKPVSEGSNANGPWTLYAIEMDEDRSATTFKESLANDARIIGSDRRIKATVEANKRKPGTWTWLDFEAIEEKDELPL